MILGSGLTILGNSYIPIYVNGNALSNSNAILKDGTTLLPVRSISNALGGKAMWDASSNTVMVVKDDIVVSMSIGDRSIYINGQENILSVPAQIVDGYTYVPLRGFGEALECEIVWDGSTKTVNIFSNGYRQPQSREEIKENILISLSKISGYHVEAANNLDRSLDYYLTFLVDNNSDNIIYAERYVELMKENIENSMTDIQTMKRVCNGEEYSQILILLQQLEFNFDKIKNINRIDIDAYTEYSDFLKEDLKVLNSFSQILPTI